MLDSVRGVVRSAIGAAEHVEADAQSHSPAAIEAKLDEMLAVLHRTCESAERHVDVVEGLANSIGPLTDAVTKLTGQLSLLLEVTAPLAAAERDVSAVEGFLHRRRASGEASPAGGAAPPT